MRLPLILAVLLTSCGGGSPVNDITVRRYEDVAGNPTPNVDSLGFTYYLDKKGNAKHGAAGWNCLINEELRFDPDDDKIVRVVIHELGRVFQEEDGQTQQGEPGWYLWDADTLPPYAEMPMDEAMWFARHGPKRVHVHDDWLADPVSEALDRINYASEFWSDAPVLERR
jgi:hypothetical protein